MPAIEASVRQIILDGNRVLVEFLVVRMNKGDVLQALITFDETIANDLYLRLVRYCLKIRMQDATFCVQCLAVPIALSQGVEAPCQLVLSLGRAGRLVLENDDMVLVEVVMNE